MTFRIEHRIGVAAPASEIWALVRDLDGWKEWTGLYTHASGTLAIGAPLEFTFQLGERAPQSLRGIVYDWVPEAQMAWSVKFMGGLVTSLRYVEIEKLGETSCILANGDYYAGPLARFVPKALRSDVARAFRAMNERAKTLVEEAWAAKGGAVVVEPDPEAVKSAARAGLKPTLSPPKFWGLGGRKPGTMGMGAS